MQPAQIYAFTPPGPLPGQSYVPFLQAFKMPDGKVEIRVRNDAGETNAIAVTVEEALKLSIALGAAKFGHDVVAARAERR